MPNLVEEIPEAGRQSATPNNPDNSLTRREFLHLFFITIVTAILAACGRELPEDLEVGDDFLNSPDGLEPQSIDALYERFIQFWNERHELGILSINQLRDISHDYLQVLDHLSNYSQEFEAFATNQTLSSNDVQLVSTYFSEHPDQPQALIKCFHCEDTLLRVLLEWSLQAKNLEAMTSLYRYNQQLQLDPLRTAVGIWYQQPDVTDQETLRYQQLVNPLHKQLASLSQQYHLDRNLEELVTAAEKSLSGFREALLQIDLPSCRQALRERGWGTSYRRLRQEIIRQLKEAVMAQVPTPNEIHWSDMPQALREHLHTEHAEARLGYEQNLIEALRGDLEGFEWTQQNYELLLKQFIDEYVETRVDAIFAESEMLLPPEKITIWFQIHGETEFKTVDAPVLESDPQNPGCYWLTPLFQDLGIDPHTITRIDITHQKERGIDLSGLVDKLNPGEQPVAQTLQIGLDPDGGVPIMLTTVSQEVRKLDQFQHHTLTPAIISQQGEQYFFQGRLGGFDLQPVTPSPNGNGFIVPEEGVRHVNCAFGEMINRETLLALNNQLAAKFLSKQDQYNRLLADFMALGRDFTRVKGYFIRAPEEVVTVDGPPAAPFYLIDQKFKILSVLGRSGHRGGEAMPLGQLELEQGVRFPNFRQGFEVAPEDRVFVGDEEYVLLASIPTEGSTWHQIQHYLNKQTQAGPDSRRLVNLNNQKLLLCAKRADVQLIRDGNFADWVQENQEELIYAGLVLGIPLGLSFLPLPAEMMGTIAALLRVFPVEAMAYLALRHRAENRGNK